MKTAKWWTWLTRVSLSALVAAMLVSAVALLATPATPVFAGQCGTVFLGAGSCISVCEKLSSCGTQVWWWDCSARNYHHYDNPDSYLRLDPPYPDYWFCQQTDPKNCHNWCN